MRLTASPTLPEAGDVDGRLSRARPSLHGEDCATGSPGANPLITAASALFSLMGHLRLTAQPPEPGRLHRTAAAEVRAFEAMALQAGADPQQVKLARYAICATIDDLAQHVPWAQAGGWQRDSMVATFHRENVGGSHFYDLLTYLQTKPEQSIDLLEVFHHCLALGFEGCLRGTPSLAEHHRMIHARLAALIRGQRGEVEPVTLPAVQPAPRLFRPRNALAPLWLTLALVAFLFPAGFLMLAQGLERQSEAAFTPLLVPEAGHPGRLSPAAPEFPPEPSQQTEAERRHLEARLAPEIAAGLIHVRSEGRTVIVQPDGERLFRPGSERLYPEAHPLLQRVATALSGVQGPVQVTVRPADQPMPSARFPTLRQLTLARAEAVRAGLAARATPSPRGTFEARASMKSGGPAVDILLDRGPLE